MTIKDAFGNLFVPLKTKYDPRSLHTNFLAIERWGQQLTETVQAITPASSGPQAWVPPVGVVAETYPYSYQQAGSPAGSGAGALYLCALVSPVALTTAHVGFMLTTAPTSETPANQGLGLYTYSATSGELSLAYSATGLSLVGTVTSPVAFVTMDLGTVAITAGELLFVAFLCSTSSLYLASTGLYRSTFAVLNRPGYPYGGGQLLGPYTSFPATVAQSALGGNAFYFTLGS